MRTKILFTAIAVLTVILLLGSRPCKPAKDTNKYCGDTGIISPVKGATSGNYNNRDCAVHGTVAWNDAPTAFASNTVYAATITLTAKAGYTLDGVAINLQ